MDYTKAIYDYLRGASESRKIDRFIPVTELAQIFGVGTNTIYRSLPLRVFIGTKKGMFESEVIEFIENYKKQNP